MAEVRETISIGSKADTRGFKQAESASAKLTRSLKNLAVAFGVTYSTAQVINFGKTSVKAFVEMQAQQDRLVRLMKVGTGATSSQIQSLNNQAAALENLGVVSKGNITQTQSQLATFNLQADTIARLTPAILDYVTAEKGAAASTEQFKQMTNGLAQALNGNFASLTKTGFVIDQNTRDIIKNGSETERAAAIVKVLDSTYKGFNKSLRDTPIGQMQLLNNAANDAKETIGGGLLDALALLGGSGTQDIENATKAMGDLSTATADVIRGQGVVLSNLGNIGGGAVGKVGNAIRVYLKEVLGIQALQDLGASTIPRPKAGRLFGGSSIQGNLYDPAAAAKAKADKLAAALAKKQLDATKKLTAEQKKQNALKKIAKVFDLDQIQLIAALKGKVSEEDKIRLQAQLAYLNDNEGVASQLTKQILMSQDATGNLYKLWSTLPDAKNPFAYLDEWLLNFQRQLALTKFPTPSAPVTITTSTGVTTTAVAPSSGSVQNFTPSYTPPANALAAGQTGFTGPIPIELKITGDGDLTNTIAKNLMQQSLSSGNQTYINRRTGGFE